MYIGLHVKYPLFLSDFNKTWIFSNLFFEKYLNTKFHENPFSGSRIVPCVQTDEQTDRMKLIVTFRNFAKAPKIRQLKYKPYYTLIMKYISTKTLLMTTVVAKYLVVTQLFTQKTELTKISHWTSWCTL